MRKILTVLGARPQIIKSAAITRIIQSEFNNSLTEIVLNTGQHYDANMSDDFFHELSIPLPKYTLSLSKNAVFSTSDMIEKIDKIVHDESPDLMVVYGDTNSTLAGAISAVKHNIPLVHIEAGMRSFNLDMPEEKNRILTDHCSRLLFSPTFQGIANLKNENINTENIFHCGDIMLDNSMYYSKCRTEYSTKLKRIDLPERDFILFTCHRQSNTDNKAHLFEIIEGVKAISKLTRKQIIFPIHPRTRKQIVYFFGQAYLENLSHVFKIIPPVGYLDTIQLEVNAEFVITDSGGLMKEAYFFEKKSLILRNQTEWVEIVELNAAVIAGCKKDQIIDSYYKMVTLQPKFEPIFGKGDAGRFICKTILEQLK